MPLLRNEVFPSQGKMSGVLRRVSGRDTVAKMVSSAHVVALSLVRWKRIACGTGSVFPSQGKVFGSRSPNTMPAFSPEPDCRACEEAPSRAKRSGIATGTVRILFPAREAIRGVLTAISVLQLRRAAPPRLLCARLLCAGLLCGLTLALAPQPARAGTVTGAATEWTQLLNNVELAQIAATEGAILSTETESLVAQLDQLRTQLAAFEIMQRNIKSLPERHLREAMGAVLNLREIAGAAQSISRSGASLDDFLRSDLITDPLFERRGLDRAGSRESYTKWNNRWNASLENGLRGAGFTLEDVESEAQLLDRISTRFGSEAGQMQVLQGANQIAASMARQMNDLRALTATQSETVTVAWGRVLARAID